MSASAQKTMREFRRTVERMGLKATARRVANHAVWDLEHPDGRATVVTMSKTPGEHRAMKNVLAEVRRFVKGCDHGHDTGHHE